MNKKIVISSVFLMFLSLLLVGHFYQKSSPSSQEVLSYAGVTWPEGSKYQLDEVGDVSISLAQDFSFAQGKWKAGTRFLFKKGSLSQVISPDKFILNEFHFDGDMMINFDSSLNSDREKIQLVGFSKLVKFDGLEVQNECKVKFLEGVLSSVLCPHFGEVPFKRNLSLPIVKDKIIQ